jgi:hypothetical protein
VDATLSFTGTCKYAGGAQLRPGEAQSFQVIDEQCATELVQITNTIGWKYEGNCYLEDFGGTHHVGTCTGTTHIYTGDCPTEEAKSPNYAIDHICCVSTITCPENSYPLGEIDTNIFTTLQDEDNPLCYSITGCKSPYVQNGTINPTTFGGYTCGLEDVTCPSDTYPSNEIGNYAGFVWQEKAGYPGCYEFKGCNTANGYENKEERLYADDFTCTGSVRGANGHAVQLNGSCSYTGSGNFADLPNITLEAYARFTGTCQTDSGTTVGDGHSMYGHCDIGGIHFSATSNNTSGGWCETGALYTAGNLTSCTGSVTVNATDVSPNTYCPTEARSPNYATDHVCCTTSTVTCPSGTYKSNEITHPEKFATTPAGLASDGITQCYQITGCQSPYVLNGTVEPTTLDGITCGLEEEYYTVYLALNTELPYGELTAENQTGTIKSNLIVLSSDIPDGETVQLNIPWSTNNEILNELRCGWNYMYADKKWLRKGGVTNPPIPEVDSDYITTLLSSWKAERGGGAYPT